MNACVVFIPSNLNLKCCYYLIGHQENTGDCFIFYVCDISISKSGVNCNQTESIIGSCSSNSATDTVRCLNDNWISLSYHSHLEIKDIIINGNQCDLKQGRLILYNKSSFFHSELILGKCFDPILETDYFKKLTYHVKSYSPPKRSFLKRSFLLVISYVVHLLSTLSLLLESASPVLKYSTFGIHLKTSSKNLHWAFKSIAKLGSVTLEAGNYLCAVCFDVIIGVIVLRYLTSVYTEREIFHIISSSTKDIVDSIVVLVEWLMGSPAGLKLNHPLNQIIGGFFLYNINLWWTFLGVIGPILKYGFMVLLHFGFLGFTFQVAIIADLLVLVTFHIYCIYVYAARLYEFQIEGLWSLSKVVIGKKRNPVPGRIDSCPYTTEQLFIGTISFTVLLFLLPTVLVYYIVFAIMRLGVTCFCEIMTRTRYYIHLLPIYATLMWLTTSSITSMSVELKASKKMDQVIWNARAVSKSWWETVIACLPSEVDPPQPIEWFPLLRNLVTGRLIYPF